MISFQHRLAVRGIKLLKLDRIIPDQLASEQSKTASPSRRQIKRHSIEKRRFEGCDVWHIRPKMSAKPRATVYMLHGGGFVTGLQPAYFAFYCKLAELSGAQIIVPDYPLPPLQTAEGVTRWVFQHFNAIAESFSTGSIYLAGDSAGGNLALLTAQHSAARIKGLILLCPWVDLLMSDSAIEICETEPLIDIESLRLAASRYADDRDLDDPRVSPIYGPLSNLPPVHIFTASHDLLHPDILRLHDKMSDAGVSVTLDNQIGLTHVYMLLPSPEGRAAVNRIAHIIQA